MPLTFPLALDAFFADLCIAEARFDLDEALSISETGGGEILTAQRGVQLWRGSVTLAPARAIPSEAMRTKIDVLRRPGATFFVEHPFLRFPQADPTGVVMLGHTPTVSALVGNARELSIAGLPTHYRISEGDHLSIAYGSGGGKRAYFRVVTGAPATSGVAGPIEVAPFIPAGVAVGNAVQIIRPAIKAVMVPGSYSGPDLRPGQIAGPVRFDWVQTTA